MTIGLSTGESYETEFHLQDAFQSQKPVIEEEKPLYVIRHGDTEFNKGEGEEERIRGWSPVPLNQDGIDDAHKTAEALKDKGITSLVSSDLPRAKQTAKIIGKAIGVTPTYEPNLRTWDMGELTGKPIKDSSVQCEEHVRDKPDTPIAGGESFNNFKSRILTGVSGALQADPDGQVAIVTHNSPERILAAWDKAGQPEDGSIHHDTYLEKGEEPGGHQVMGIGPSIHDIQSMTHTPPDEALNRTANSLHSLLRDVFSGSVQPPTHLPGTQPKDYLKELANNPDILEKEINNASNFNFLGSMRTAGVASKGGMRLVPTEHGEGSFHLVQGEGEEAAHIGNFDSSYDKRTKTIHVNYTSTSLRSPMPYGSIALKANWASHALGPRNIRDLLYALKEEFPEAEWVEGFRVTGAKSDAGRRARGEDTSVYKNADQPIRMPKNRRPPGGDTPLDPEFERELSDLVKTIKPQPENTRIRSPMESVERAQEVERQTRSIANMTDEEWGAFERQLRSDVLPHSVRASEPRPGESVSQHSQRLLTMSDDELEAMYRNQGAPSRPSMEQEPFVDSRTHREWSNLPEGQRGGGHRNARQHSTTVPYDIEVRSYGGRITRYRNGQEVDF